MGTPTWLIDLGLETASPDESLTRPDLRQIATFFSGILFAASLYYFLHSPTLASIFSCFLRKTVRASTASIDAPRETPSDASTSMSHHFDPLALVFILDLVYITTAATQFGSLLSFSSGTGAVPCTFLVAWSALGSETVRLIGLVKLTLHLRERGASQWEKYILWGVLTVSAIFMFLTAAVSTGVLRAIPGWESRSFCHIRHFFLGAAVLRGLNLAIELYVLARFISLLFPWIPAVNSKIQVAADVQIHRALSLVVLDGATIYPSLFPTSLLADFIPFSAASIFVLTAFNHNILPKQSLVSSILNVNAPSLPQSIRIPTPNFSPFLNMESSTSASKERSIVELNLDRASGRSIRVFDAEKGYPHPFAAASITSPQPPRQWRSPNRVAVSAVEHPESLTDSMRNAVVTTANGARLYPAGDPVFLTTGARGVPAMRRSRASQDASVQRSFLPALRNCTNGSHEPSSSRSRRPKPPPNDTRMGRQILVRQVEVADQMIAGPRPSHHEHRPLGCVSSQDHTTAPAPPAPPRVQRVLRQDVHPMVILTDDNNNPGETRPSTTDSAVVYGSDILIRSQDDVMRIRGEILESSGGTGDASVGHGSRRDSGSFRNSNLSLRIVNPSQHSLAASTAEGHGSLAGDITRPHTGLSHARTDVDALSVVHEGLPTPARAGESHASRKIRKSHRPATFGESLFDRFQRGFTFSDASSTDPPPSVARLDTRGDQSRSSRLAPGSRLRSSTVGSGRGSIKRRDSSPKRPST